MSASTHLDPALNCNNDDSDARERGRGRGRGKGKGKGNSQELVHGTFWLPAQKESTADNAFSSVRP